jgi:hypothetical protein
VAAAATWAVMTSGVYLGLLALAPLYLTYRTYKVYLGRIDDERRHVEAMADLHLATIEALALAIDAKDQTTQTHIRRVQVYAHIAEGALDFVQNLFQRVAPAAATQVHLLRSIGTGKQNPVAGAVQPPHQVEQQAHGGAIGPVDIIQDQEQGTAGRDGVQHVGVLIKQEALLQTGRVRLCPRHQR